MTAQRSKPPEKEQAMTRLPLIIVVLIALGSPIAPGSAGEDAKALKGTFATTFMREKWTITFDGDKMFTVKKKGELMVAGAYKVDKDRITFDDQSGPLASEKNSPGTYKWKLLNKRLTFTKIKDQVEGRVLALTSDPWTETKVEKKDGKKPSDKKPSDPKED
jgi:hypothetical protein